MEKALKWSRENKRENLNYLEKRISDRYDMIDIMQRSFLYYAKKVRRELLKRNKDEKIHRVCEFLEDRQCLISEVRKLEGELIKRLTKGFTKSEIEASKLDDASVEEIIKCFDSSEEEE